MKKGQLLKADCDLYLSVCPDDESMTYVEKGSVVIFLEAYKEDDFTNIVLLFEDTVCSFSLSKLDEIEEYFMCV